MEPFGAWERNLSETDCTPEGAECLGPVRVSGTYLVDIDQNPSLNGVPLTVTLAAQKRGGLHFLLSVNASMSIRLEKK